MNKATYPEDKRELVEKALHRFFPGEDAYPEVIYKAMSHSLFSGGKRFRSVLSLLTAVAFNVNPEKILPTACALEFIHTYSLIHDDLPAIDNDDLRRGKPTCHVLFGEDIAILAGDALFAEAFHLVASSQNSSDQSRIIKVINEIALAAGIRGMVSGQVADICSMNKKIDADTLDFIHTHKTGQLIIAAARSGAILAGAEDAELKNITEFAHYLGLAFQITDDILDVVGDVDVLGKQVGSDERHHKATFPAVFGIEDAKCQAEEAINKSIEALSGMRIETKELTNLARFVYERDF